jgi:hypothetical protein
MTPLNERPTPTEQNIAIAETQGAKWYLHASGYSWLSFSKLDDHPQWSPIEKPSDASKIVVGDSVPDYHGSLDAIVPVVRAMPTAKKTAVLCVLCANTADTEAALTATPAQWCEAVLREEGLWK